MSTVRLFTLDGAQRHDAAVEAWLAAAREPLGSIARHWFDVMRACGADVGELLHDGHPTACVGNAAFAYVNVFTDHLNVGLYPGASLPDPAGLLEGSGRFMRHTKIRPGVRIDEAALGALIVAAYQRMKDESNRHD